MKKIILITHLLLFSPALFALETTLLIIGDSLTEGYNLSPDKSFPSLLQKKFEANKTPVKVINAGSSGSTSASGESRLRWHLKSKPQFLILALGANDGLRGLSTESMQTNLEKTILLAQKNKIPVMLVGMKMPLNYGNDYRLKYEKVFADLAKKHSLPFIPFLLEGVATIKALNLPDGIHPNEKGYEKIAEAIYPSVEKFVKGKK